MSYRLTLTQTERKYLKILFVSEKIIDYFSVLKVIFLFGGYPFKNKCLNGLLVRM